MKWITRKNIKVDRVACPWLIRKFIDPQAEFFFVDSNSDLENLDGHTFDMRGAEYGHEGDKCTFQVLLDRHGLCGDVASTRPGNRNIVTNATSGRPSAAIWIVWS